MWSTIKSWLGSNEAVEKGIDLVGAGLDMSIYTAEEKSIAGQKILDWKLNWIKATGAQSVARRVIAFVVVGLWAYLVMLGVHLHVILGRKEEAKFVFDVLTEIVTNPFLMVMGFFYAAHLIRAGGK